MRRSVFVLLSSIFVLIAATYVPGAAAQTGGADSDIPGGHFYTQANGGAGAQYGYRITNDGGIGFWNEFQRLGGVSALGYPASRRFMMDGFFVQATQKYILQWRPEVGQAYFVNVFDKLHDSNQDNALQSQFGIPAPADPSISQSTRLSWLSADAGIAAKYGSGNGAIQANGLPTSQVVQSGPYKIIRNQRDAIQDWTAPGPGGITPGTVTVVNGGDVAKVLGLVPADAQITETAQGQPAAAPAPAAPPAPAPTAVPNYPFLSKLVTDTPRNCGQTFGDPNYVPCTDSNPNAGTQKVYGHIMDKNGGSIAGIIVQALAYGNTYNANASDSNGIWSFTISTTCPVEHRVYQFYVVDGQGRQSSDMHTITYDNCNSAGEFHFDFVRQS